MRELFREKFLDSRIRPEAESGSLDGKEMAAGGLLTGDHCGVYLLLREVYL